MFSSSSEYVDILKHHEIYLIILRMYKHTFILFLLGSQLGNGIKTNFFIKISQVTFSGFIPQRCHHIQEALRECILDGWLSVYKKNMIVDHSGCMFRQCNAPIFRKIQARKVNYCLPCATPNTFQWYSKIVVKFLPNICIILIKLLNFPFS